MNRLFLFLSILVLPLSLSAQELYSEGVDYQKLEEPQKGGGEQVEVIEFFRYACPGCNAFEPHINSWKKNRKPADVKFTLIPAIFGSSDAVAAKAFYSGKAMGVLDKSHAAIFDAIHRQKKPFQTAEHFAAIVAARGIDKKKFLDTMNSFEVDANTGRARQQVKNYKIPSVPIIIVNGRYMVTGSMAKSLPRMLDVIDYLVKMEKARLKKSKS